MTGMKPPTFSIQKTDNGYNLLGQNGETLVAGFESGEMLNDFMAKMLAGAIAANLGKAAEALKNNVKGHA